MRPRLDETHDPERRSWLESANAEGCEFPVQNLPSGMFRAKGERGPARPGVAIGDQVLDLAAVARFDEALAQVLARDYPDTPLDVPHRLWAMLGERP